MTAAARRRQARLFGLVRSIHMDEHNTAFLVRESDLYDLFQLDADRSGLGERRERAIVGT